MKRLSTFVRHETDGRTVDDGVKRREKIARRRRRIVDAKVRVEIVGELDANFHNIRKVDEESTAHVGLVASALVRRTIAARDERTILQKTAAANFFGSFRRDDFSIEMIEHRFDVVFFVHRFDVDRRVEIGRERRRRSARVGEIRIEIDLKRIDGELIGSTHATDEFEFDVSSAIVSKRDERPAIVIAEYFDHFIDVRFFESRRAQTRRRYADRHEIDETRENDFADVLEIDVVRQIDVEEKVEVVEVFFVRFANDVARRAAVQANSDVFECRRF